MQHLKKRCLSKNCNAKISVSNFSATNEPSLYTKLRLNSLISVTYCARILKDRQNYFQQQFYRHIIASFLQMRKKYVMTFFIGSIPLIVGPNLPLLAGAAALC